jgi:CelD/BcsL family acetyltransferase involved in cellulose biosynthesis
MNASLQFVMNELYKLITHGNERHIPVLAFTRLIHVGQGTKITVCTAAEDMLQLRPLWERLWKSGHCTVFQDFRINLLAAERFAGREQPYVICAKSPNGVAIVPAALRHSDHSIRMLGEELFDYRCFLHNGDDEALRLALAALTQLQRPLEIVAMREVDRGSVPGELELLPFCAAPAVCCSDISADAFAAAHTRLARNLRRLERLGFELRRYDGSNSQLLRSIYAGKAGQRSTSLFHDPARIEFLVSAAGAMQEVFEIFTLENGLVMAAALVVLRDGGCRRFYTGWFAPDYEKHSPALALIYEVTRLSLAAGLDCDYMTGKQPYKMRLATSSVPLYRVRATVEQLASAGPVASDSFGQPDLPLHPGC